MSTTFRRVDGGVRLRLGADESMMVGVLIEQLLSLLDSRSLGTGAGGAEGAEGAEDAAGEVVAGLADLPDLGIAENAERPEDPALGRLFPDGYREDEESAREFRRYTEAPLMQGKREAAELVLRGLRDTPPGGEIALDDEQAQGWLRALNDLRLVLGTRLQITDDSYDGPPPGLDPDGPLFALFAAYDWLTALQDQLVRTLW